MSLLGKSLFKHNAILGQLSASEDLWYTVSLSSPWPSSLNFQGQRGQRKPQMRYLNSTHCPWYPAWDLWTMLWPHISSRTQLATDRQSNTTFKIQNVKQNNEAIWSILCCPTIISNASYKYNKQKEANKRPLINTDNSHKIWWLKCIYTSTENSFSGESLQMVN